MKQSLLILGLAMAMFSMTSCTKDPVVNADVPEKVQQEFKSRYPQVSDVLWDRVQDYHVARFNSPATKADASTYNTNAWFTSEGQFCQTDEDVDFDCLPQPVQDACNTYMKTLYPDWKIDECELLAREGMSPVFVIEIENADLEREISISETGEILKDVLDDDDEDEVLPIIIPDEVYAALEKIFPDTYSSLSLLELEIDDDEIEIDVMESDRHKEIKLDGAYRLVSIEYEISFEEARGLMDEAVFLKLADLAKMAGIDVFDKTVQDNMEIELKETAKGLIFEIEIEIDDVEFEVEIDEQGNMKIED